MTVDWYHTTNMGINEHTCTWNSQSLSPLSSKKTGIPVSTFSHERQRPKQASKEKSQATLRKHTIQKEDNIGGKKNQCIWLYKKIYYNYKSRIGGFNRGTF